MFEHLDDDAAPAPAPAPVDDVMRRGRRFRFQRRALLASSIAAIAVVTLASGAAVRAATTNRVNIATSPTREPDSAAATSTTTGAPDTTTPTTTPAPTATTPSSTPGPTAPPPPPPPAADRSHDTSALRLSVSPASIELMQGNSVTVNVNVQNTGSWAATPGAAPCTRVHVEPLEQTACYRPAGDEPLIAPGATASYPVEIVATGDFTDVPTAVRPDDYDVSIPFLETLHLLVHVTSATTTSLNPTNVSLRAGDPLVVALTVQNASDSVVRYEVTPSPCQLTPSQGFVCTQALPIVPVPAHGSATKQITILTQGAPPGHYRLRIADQVLDVTVTG